MNDRPEPVTTLRDVLDDAADLSMAGRGLDPAAVVARAGRPEYRPVVGRGAPRWRGRPVLGPRLLVAAAVLLVLLTLATTFLPRVLAESPLPAQTPPSEPGLPRTLRLAPVWTPSITEAPIARAAYVVTSAGPSSTDLGVDLAPSAGTWLVGADDGALRALPAVSGGPVELAADGRRVGWLPQDVDGGGSPVVPPDRIAVLDVATGVRQDLRLPAPAGRTFDVRGFRFDPAGHVLAVWGYVADPDGTLEAYVLVVDVRTGATRPVCRPETVDYAAAWQRPGVVAAARCTPVTAADAGTWPAADGTAADRPAVRSVPAADLPAGPFPNLFPLPGMSALPVVDLAPDGTRWVVTDDAPGEPVSPLLDDGVSFPVSAFLVTSGGIRTPLGGVGGVSGLATVGDAAVVSRWVPRDRDSTLGPSDVVRVPLGGGDPEVLTRAEGEQVRAVAVAADAVASGRFFDAPVVETYGDRAWWRYNLELVDLTRLWFLAALVGGTIAVVRVRLWWQLRRRRP